MAQDVSMLQMKSNVQVHLILTLMSVVQLQQQPLQQLQQQPLQQLQQQPLQQLQQQPLQQLQQQPLQEIQDVLVLQGVLIIITDIHVQPQTMQAA
jgi:hypothetical protein